MKTLEAAEVVALIVVERVVDGRPIRPNRRDVDVLRAARDCATR